MDTAVNDSLKELFLSMGKRFGWFNMPLVDMIATLDKEIKNTGETSKILNKRKSDYSLNDHGKLHQGSDVNSFTTNNNRDVDDLSKDSTDHFVKTMASSDFSICKRKDQEADLELAATENNYNDTRNNYSLLLSKTLNAITSQERIRKLSIVELEKDKKTPGELNSFNNTKQFGGDDDDDNDDDVWYGETRGEKTPLESTPMESYYPLPVRQTSCDSNTHGTTLLEECIPKSSSNQQVEISDSPVKESLTTRLFKKYNPEKSESDLDDFELFLQKVKTPKPPNFQTDERENEKASLDDFIVDDDDVSDAVFEEVFFTPRETNSDSDSDDCIELETPGASSLHPCPPASDLDNLLISYSSEKKFKENKSQLVKDLFELYNRTIFDNQGLTLGATYVCNLSSYGQTPKVRSLIRQLLPSDFQITWNKKMRSTAGFCYYSRKDGVRVSRIELADKVIDSADRLRDTLVHEMCHAAAWVISGVKAGHGPVWKQWTRRANIVHRSLPPISRCHSYTVNTKYTYRCTNIACGNTFGRHSKSVNCEKSRCGHCHGRLELVPQVRKDGTPQTRTPSRFAMFVKENFARVKRDNGTFSHQDIMKTLSSEFAKLNSN